MKAVTFTLSSLIILGGIATLAVVQSGKTSEANEPQQAAEKAASTKADARVADLKKLAGEWKVVDWRIRGGRLFRGGVGRKYTFQGDKLTVERRPGSEYRQRIHIDPTQQHKTLDMTSVEVPITRPAIYKFDGDKLIICQGSIHASVTAEPGRGTNVKTDTSRPQAFRARGDWNLITLERVR